jgi:hypothetical protein
MKVKITGVFDLNEVDSLLRTNGFVLLYNKYELTKDEHKIIIQTRNAKSLFSVNSEKKVILIELIPTTKESILVWLIRIGLLFSAAMLRGFIEYCFSIERSLLLDALIVPVLIKLWYLKNDKIYENSYAKTIESEILKIEIK